MRIFVRVHTYWQLPSPRPPGTPLMVASDFSFGTGYDRFLMVAACAKPPELYQPRDVNQNYYQFQFSYQSNQFHKCLFALSSVSLDSATARVGTRAKNCVKLPQSKQCATPDGVSTNARKDRRRRSVSQRSPGYSRCDDGKKPHVTDLLE